MLNPFEVLKNDLESQIAENRKILQDILSKLSTNENEKLSVKEVSDELGVSKITVHNHIKKGIIPASKIGRRVFIKRCDLDNAMAEVKSLKYKR